MQVLFILPFLLAVSSEAHEYTARVFTDLYDKPPHKQPEDIKVKTDDEHKLKEVILSELERKGYYTRDEVFSMHTRPLSEIEKSKKGVEIKDDTEAIPWQERLHKMGKFELYVSKAKTVKIFKLNDAGKSEDMGITIRIRSPMSTRRIIKEAIADQLKASTKYKDYKYNQIFLSDDQLKGKEVEYSGNNVEHFTNLYLFKAQEIDYEKDITFKGDKMLKKLQNGTKIPVQDHDIADNDVIVFEDAPPTKLKVTLKQYNNGSFESHNEIWEHVIKDPRLKEIAYKMSKLTAVMQDGSQKPLASNSYSAKIDCREIKELIASTSARERIKIRQHENLEAVKFIYLGEVATGKHAWEKINSFGNPWTSAVVAYRINSDGKRTTTKVENKDTDFHKTSEFVGLEIAINEIVYRSPASYESHRTNLQVRVNYQTGYQTGYGSRLGVPQQHIGGFQQHRPGFPNNGFHQSQFGQSSVRRTGGRPKVKIPGGLANMAGDMLHEGEGEEGEGEGGSGSSHGSDNGDGGDAGDPGEE
ncbi:hypothetical protein DdX_22146 [Ditylenchus destructor]|uniref:Uncharacterized protein n=1 Tax=Ditylenchus destructor TaxID=166010 RepID=A0AAD4MDZ6_9BILA|nr:hypothetical protein DdX_22146 [Ditylenchus destructor]